MAARPQKRAAKPIKGPVAHTKKGPDIWLIHTIWPQGPGRHRGPVRVSVPFCLSVILPVSSLCLFSLSPCLSLPTANKG